MRTLILDSHNPSGTFLTDLPTQVLVQDDQASPPVTLARLVFPIFSNPLAEITVTSPAKSDPLVVPALETDWLAPGIRVTISSTGDSELQPALAFSVCFTSSSANSIIAYLGEGGNSWVELESQHSGDQVCTASNKPGIFILVDSIP